MKPFLREKTLALLLGGSALFLGGCPAEAAASSSSVGVSSVSSSSMAVVSSSASPSLVTSEDSSFDFDALNELTFDLDAEAGSFSALEGLNIAEGDYAYSENKITLKKDFLITLDPGSYSLAVETDRGSYPLTFSVLDKNNAYRIPNGGFETGDLFGYTASTAFKGESSLQAFVDEAVVANGDIPSFATPYGGSGGYVLGYPAATSSQSAWEERMGRLSTRVFTLGGNGYLSFALGACFNSDLTYLSVLSASSGDEIARYGNPSFSLDAGAYHAENLVRYRADLSAHLGEKLYLQLVDLGGHSFNFMTADDLETFHTSIPDGTDAVDVKPSFDQVYVTNQLVNGNFSSGLSGWSVSSAAAWENSSGVLNAWQAPSGFLRSDLGGDAAIGLIRSSLFRIEGSGVMSLQLAAGQGSRYDKDTFVSVRLEGSNREIYRLANERHSGVDFVSYYLDLSSYLGADAYLEIVDNASGSWDTIFVEDIVTYYASYPLIDFGDMAANLNR